MNEIKLLYLTEENLKDRLFIKDLVHNFPEGEKLVLLHEAFGGTVSDTRFVTKRISALFSERMVYNNAFSSDQRGLITEAMGQYTVNLSLIQNLFAHIQLLILNPVISLKDEPVLAPATALARVLREALPGTETVMFPDNPLSPLAAKRPTIEKSEDADYWMALFDEETKMLKKALSLAPVQVASPANYQS